MSYKTHIGSRRWNEIRQRILARCAGRCESCGAMRPLQIHHLNYDRVGYERDSDLAGLCGFCHAKQHNIKIP
jgi:5-methylcytosine-specific restriction endonuclease McrA